MPDDYGGKSSPKNMEKSNSKIYFYLFGERMWRFSDCFAFLFHRSPMDMDARLGRFRFTIR